MDEKTGNGHLTETEHDLIRRLFGFGRKKEDYQEILRKKPSRSREELQQVERSALRKLRHLDITELTRMRRAG
jgi:DNA-directed RNA polymerase sigma subunit (sigma70/sigma32)